MNSIDDINENDAETGKHRAPLRISDRDKEIFKFLWRFRAGTMRGIRAMFFSDSSLGVCHRRLVHLRKFGYLSSSFLECTENRLWRIGERGFYAIRDQVGQSKLGKYYSHAPQVDHIAMSTLLGDWYLKAPGLATIITNQELVHASSLDAETRPAGIWRFRIGPTFKSVALRIDLGKSNVESYKKILLRPPAYECTIWIAPTSNARSIRTTLTKFHDVILDEHFILDLEDIRRNLWRAKIKGGPLKGVSLGIFLSSFLTIKPTAEAPNSSVNSCPNSTHVVAHKYDAFHPLLDFRGTYEKSIA